MRYIKGFFIVLGVMASLFIAGLVVVAVVEEKAPSEPDSLVLDLDLTTSIVEQSEPSALDLALEQPEPLSILDIVTLLERASHDPHVKGIVAKVGTGDYSLAQAQEIRQASF